VQRAQGLYKAAALEQKLGSENASADQKELAQAKVDAAKADLDLAQYLLEQTGLRLPFAGEVLRFLVAEGQFVKAGEAVAVVGETSKLAVEIPVERSKVDRAKTMSIKVDGEEVESQVQAVLPLDRKFDPLRELFDSLTSALLVVDNSKRNFQPGQTVFVPLIPRHPVVEVPSGAIGNRADGGRKVQVLRNSVVRDVPVELMGSVGADRLYVNGPFADGDEVIFESSHQLADGFPVKAGGGGKTARTDGDTAKPNTKPAQPTSGF
jgi:RND family efflux transporter MFP subunit